MRINEIFFSVQGEGARTGEPSIFIRLTGCDMSCGFCDTEFESGKEMSDDEVLSYILKYSSAAVKPWITWTGGEPTLQLTEQTVELFNRNGFKQSIETNGAHPVPSGLAWVACSPKVAEHVLCKNFPDGIDELRYVRHSGQMAVPVPSIKAKRLYLSPMFDGNNINVENLKHCLKLCLENPQWSLSLQTHKLIKVL